MQTICSLLNPDTSRCQLRLALFFVFVLSSLISGVFCESIATPSSDVPPTITTSSAESPLSTSVDGSEKTGVPVTSVKKVTASSVGIPGASPTSTSTCPSRTVNYITHTLPQKCLKTNRVAAGNHTVSIVAESQARKETASTDSAGSEQRAGDASLQAQIVDGSETRSIAQESGSISSLSLASVQAEETDSPLDNANFLSFEEWKRQNLVRLEQSLDGDGRAKAEGGRQRPDIADTLGSLGEDGDFSIGFGFGGSGNDEPPAKQKPSQGDKSTGSEEKAAPSDRPKKKDAGTTCKERFNYASLDCAATVLKTNSKCKSASSVLVENKDSYMLNECSTDNKFLIVELCDDILVDTVVLANFEFFSSMFRTFRISVSDRYPVKIDRWKELGVFEARNAREIQAFAIENPLIWARYLRVEFLSHFGAEFYCPVSLLRVHGTTMLEEMRNAEGNSRGDDESEEEVAVPSFVESPPLVVTSIAVEEKPNLEPTKAGEESPSILAETLSPSTEGTSARVSQQSISSSANSSASITSSFSTETDSPPFIGPQLPASVVENANKVGSPLAASTVKPESISSSNITPSNTISPSGFSTTSNQTSQSAPTTKLATSTPSKAVSEVVDRKIPASVQSGNASSNISIAKVQSSTSDTGKPSTVVVQPPSPSPTTQESFFKSFHKRLQVLESNATLSLQYIEEQSRILRDAFTKVEKRQTSKIDDFIHHLNNTVMTELRNFRQQYDQLWQSTVIELDTHRDQYQHEILAVSSRLSLLAEELVWQKRMAVVQSTLLILCLGLIIFVRSGGGHFELPLMQNVFNKSHSYLGIPYDSPRDISSSKDSSPHQQARRLIRIRSVDDLQDSEDEARLMGSPSPSPSPSRINRSANEDSDFNITPMKNTDNTEILDHAPADTPMATARLHQLLRPSRSGPATPRGTRDTQDPLQWVDRTIENSPLSRASSINAAPESPIALTNGEDDSSEMRHINGFVDSGTEVLPTSPAQED